MKPNFTPSNQNIIKQYSRHTQKFQPETNKGIKIIVLVTTL